MLFFFVIVRRDCRMRMRVCDANEKNIEMDLTRHGHILLAFVCRPSSSSSRGDERTMGFD